MRIPLLLLVAVVMLSTGCGRSPGAASPSLSLSPSASVAASPSPLPIGTMPEFKLTDQGNATFSRKDMLGHPSVVAFIYTTCSSTCPAVVASMKMARSKISDPNVRCVLFSVDPEADTPAVLAKYAQGYHLERPTWEFLTGDASQILGVQRALHLVGPAVQKLTIDHSTRLIVVDAEGNARAMFHYNNAGDLARLTAMLSSMTGPSPAP